MIKLHQVGKGVQCAMNDVILTGFHLNGNSEQRCVIIDQVIYLTLAAVIIAEHRKNMGDQFAGKHSFIDRSHIDAAFISRHCTDVIAVENTRQNANVAQIQFSVDFSCGFDHREGWIGDCLSPKESATVQIADGRQSAIQSCKKA